MTLNITILTPEVIYQSADYRLFDTNARKSLPMHSNKTVILMYLDWVGFITYTGIGRVNSKDTSQFVRDWLKGKRDFSFADVVEAIRVNASSWIRGVDPSIEHTFVVAGFVDSKPVAAVVSNCQKWHGAKLDSVSENFASSIVTAKRSPEIIVTGRSNAVPRPQRQKLRWLAANHADDPARIRRALAEATRCAAQRYPNLISDECYVYSQDKNGRGHEETMGDTMSNPTTLLDGVDLLQQIRPFLYEHFGSGKWAVKGATFVRSGGQSEPPSSCELRLSTRLSDGGRYNLVELANPYGRYAAPRAVNAQGTIVGEGAQHWRGPNYPCVWPEHSTIQFLPHGGGFGGCANDINDSGMIVGASEMPDRALHACVWDINGSTDDIGQALGRNSNAMRVNRGGSIVGWASIHPTEGGQEHFRPAWWPNTGSPVILKDLDGAWGEAVDINTSDQMVLRAHVGRSVDAWLWDGEDGYRLEKPSPELRAFWPKCLTEENAVIGLTIHNNGQRSAAVRHADGTCAFLLSPSPGREFTTAKGTQIIAGYDQIDGYGIPWVKQENEEIAYLPSFKYHHHKPTMISEQGWILGTASADNCCHPLLWIPEQTPSDI